MLPDARQLVANCRPLRADAIVILRSEPDVPTALALAALSDLPAEVRVIPVGPIDLMAVSRITQFGNIATVRIFQYPLTPFNRAIKRAFAVAAAIAGLILVSPLFVIVPLAIKLDSRGPVLFRQIRHGYNNERSGQRLPRRNRHPREDATCRVKHDLYNIDNRSLLLDLKIMVLLPFSRKVYWNAQ